MVASQLVHAAPRLTARPRLPPQSYCLEDVTRDACDRRWRLLINVGELACSRNRWDHPRPGATPKNGFPVKRVPSRMATRILLS